MKRLLGIAIAIGLLISVAALSGNPLPFTELQVKVEDKNPWTHLKLNNQPDDFQFAIVSDRTGGHRPRIFSQTVDRLNLLQPEFVMSVGDLIEGGLEEREPLDQQWREFQGYVAKLQMPFFYVPGNHDISNKFQEEFWGERFGRRYYHFVYKNVLFLMLDSEDPPKSSRISADQLAYIKAALDANPNVRWTIAALHKPLWIGTELVTSNWVQVEKLLSGRPYTVFCGHVHIYQRYVRNGMKYYQLATTGGGSKLRGTRYGEFDHVAWVTMKKTGPLIANLMVDGILPEDLRHPSSDEEGVRRTLLATHPVKGKVLLDGKPTPGALVIFHPIVPDQEKKRRLPRADGMVDEDGTFSLTTYQADDGAPPGDYGVTIVWKENAVVDEGEVHGVGKNRLPAKYARTATSGLRVQIKEGPNTLEPFRLTAKEGM